jgi:hypothetical protein
MVNKILKQDPLQYRGESYQSPRVRGKSAVQILCLPNSLIVLHHGFVP